MQCKFYNELGRILVRDFTPVQLDELQGEPDDNDFHSTSRQDIGKLEYSLAWDKQPPPPSVQCKVFWTNSNQANEEFSICVSSEAAADIQEDRRKVPWSDKETIILLEIWGDPQVKLTSL